MVIVMNLEPLILEITDLDARLQSDPEINLNQIPPLAYHHYMLAALAVSQAMEHLNLAYIYLNKGK